MYYEERIIGGSLCRRISPDSEWVPFTAHELTVKLMEAREKLDPQAPRHTPAIGPHIVKGEITFPSEWEIDSAGGYRQTRLVPEASKPLTWNIPGTEKF